MANKPGTSKTAEKVKAPITPPNSPTLQVPTPSRPSRRKSPPKRLTSSDPVAVKMSPDDSELPQLREVIPRNEALVSPPIVKPQKKGKIGTQSLSKKTY